MSTTDERDDGSVDVARPDDAEGDDIVVIPGPADAERTRRRRVAFALGGVVVALAVVGLIALVARDHGSSSPSAIVRTSPTTISTKAIADTHAKTTVPHKKKVAPVVVVTTTPTTAAAKTVVTSPHVVVPPPTSPPAVAPTIAAPKQYSASALTWTAPKTLTVAAGKTAALAVIAHNGTDGTITLPHPLACTPRLDHSEMCTEMAQMIGSGQSASARYTIDARGIAAGQYVLNIEGVLTVTVTVR